MKYSTRRMLRMRIVVGCVGCSAAVGCTGNDSKDAGKLDAAQTADSTKDQGFIGDLVQVPDGYLTDLPPGPDCGPRPQVGECNECECWAELGWMCTLVACDVAESDLGTIDIGSKPDSDPDEDVILACDFQTIGNCCSTDADCTSVMSCIGATDELQGTCQRGPSMAYCYEQAHCDPYFECVGAVVCKCNEECETVSGTCQTAGAGCCETDADCPADTKCYLKEDGSGSNCLPAPTHDWLCRVQGECGEDETCTGAQWPVCGGELATLEWGYCEKTTFAQCVQMYSGCECEMGCMDGYSVVVYYPGPEQEFPFGVSPPDEVLDAGVFKYECGVCNCTETWAAKVDGEWIGLEEEGVEGFCTRLLEYSEGCGNCLVGWWGGAG